jgi:iron complex transport system ATP-binding protein
VSARYDAGAGAKAPPEAALAEVSLTVAGGERVFVIGPNGAGKSTLLRVLAGTLRPHEGEARLFGTRIAERERRDVARDVAFVAQSEEVRFAFSVRQVVLMGRAPHQDGWMRPSAEDARVLDDVLARFDLLALADRSVDQLSGGERKRVAIARAFAQASRVLLLDEPTAFLDVRHQVLLFAELDQAARTNGTTSVIVTHDLQLAAAQASRIVLMKAGRIVAEGTVEEVLTDARLEKTFDWPIAVGRVAGTGERAFIPRSR